MPPIFKINLKRNSGSRPDARKIHYLTDGTVTEVKFFDALFNSTNYITNKNIRLIKCEKTGDDEGVSNGIGLIKLAKNYIQNSNDFIKGYDKVLIIFDLDVYQNNYDEIIRYIKEEDDIIFSYSNPSFEIPLMMCLDENFLVNLDSDTREKFISNDYVGEDRYAYWYIKTHYSFDSKDRKSDFLSVARKYANAKQQDVNIYIDLANKSITCNLIYILEKIEQDDIESITYFSKED